MDFDTPLSRNEAILQNILGADNVLVAPQSRIEAILQAILNDSSYDAEALSRMEELLLAIKDGGTWDKTPISRNEEILVAKLNGETYDKAPQSRIEELLIEWCNAPAWVEKTVSGSIVSISDAIASPVIDLKANITATQSGSGDPSPDNVRPIVGWDSVSVVRCGKNLLDDKAEVYYNYTINADGSINDSNSGDRFCTDFIPCVPNTNYTISGNPNPSNIMFTFGAMVFYDENKNFISRVGSTYRNSPLTGLSPNNARYIRFCEYLTGSGATLAPSYLATYKRQMEIGSTATAYEPYNGNTYTINLGGTYYGGVLDVTSGVLRVTWIAVALENCTWIKQTTESPIRWRSTSVSNYKTQSIYSTPTNVLVEQFKLEPYAGSSVIEDVGYLRITNGNIYAYTQDENSTPSGKVVYELSEPFTIQLTPQQVQLLANQVNTIFADSGDVEVTYKAQPE